MIIFQWHYLNHRSNIQVDFLQTLYEANLNGVENAVKDFTTIPYDAANCYLTKATLIHDAANCSLTKVTL